MLFYVWEGATVWAHSFHKDLSDLGPTSRVVHILSPSVLAAGSGCSLMSAESQVFSFFGALGAQKLTFGGLVLLVTVTSLFTDMAGNIPFLNTLP